jgi:succinate dehydrogenase / fumarate reductase cytochrome b subunit
MTRTVWDSTVGKKIVMATSGLIMLSYLVVHLYGNLKVFFGLEELNGYAEWIRNIGQPFMHHVWTLWLVRAVLVLALVAHVVTAYQLSRLDIKARPTKYVHSKPRTTYFTHTMRWGGIVLGLFIVWHILDLTTGTVHPGQFEDVHPYENLIDTFSTWYSNVIYIAAMLALGLHLQHGVYSAAQTLGVSSRRADRAWKISANVLALVLTAGFISIPVGVMTGLVH